MKREIKTKGLHWSVEILRRLIVPTLSEVKVVGIFIICLICVLPPVVLNLVIMNGYGIEQESRIAGAVVVFGAALFLLYRLAKIYKNVELTEMLKQKQTDRIVATLITGLAATQVFQVIMNETGSYQSAGFAGDSLAVFAGMRAFVGLMFLAMFTTYTRGFNNKNRVTRERGAHMSQHGSQWVGDMIDITYSDSQVNRTEFILSILMATASALLAIQFYVAVWWQILLAYAIYDIISSVFKNTFGQEHTPFIR